MNIRTPILIATLSFMPAIWGMDFDTPPAKVCKRCMEPDTFGFGNNPLHRACLFNHPKCVQALLENEVRWFGDQEPRWMNQTNNLPGWTPLHCAAHDAHIALMHLLLATPGINVNATDKKGRTPLYWAADDYYIQVTKLLLATPNISINATDNWNDTPLHRAAQWGHDQTVQLLLAAGANPTMQNLGGKSPRDLAISHGHTVIANILREAEAKANPNKTQAGANIINEEECKQNCS